MPRIPPKFLDCVCYLYESEEKALSGKEFGGTGFLIAVPSRFPNRSFIYVVTNHHVACTGGASVVRLNTKDGGTDVFPFEPHEWVFDSRYDIAVHPITLDFNHHKVAVIGTDSFITPEMVEKQKISIGEDVFMVGRFIDHDGVASNMPAARFGNISVMPSPIEQPNGAMADAYCIDLHSRSGYSGSPVFVYRTPGYDLEEAGTSNPKEIQFLLSGINMLAFLGIHFAQFPEQWEIAQGTHKASKEASSVPLIAEGAYIKGLSGMTCVLPAWTLLEVLNSPKLERPRLASDAAEQARRDSEGHPPVAE